LRVLVVYIRAIFAVFFLGILVMCNLVLGLVAWFFGKGILKFLMYTVEFFIFFDVLYIYGTL